MKIDQIVRETADKICQMFADALGESIGVNTQQLEAIIQSAIEKAMKDAYVTGYNEGLTVGYDKARATQSKPPPNWKWEC